MSILVLQLKFREGLADEKHLSRAVIQSVQQDNLQDFKKLEGGYYSYLARGLNGFMKTARWPLAIFESGFRFFVPEKGGSVCGTQAVPAGIT